MNVSPKTSPSLNHPSISMDSQPQEEKTVQMTYSVPKRKFSISFAALTQQSLVSGPDQISASMLRVTATSITPAVTKLFNILIKTGELPTDWKLALVTPIPKSGDRSDPNNYQPISLLSILSKLLEKHIYNCIVNHVEEQSPISEKQWGFTKGKATISVLPTAVESWHNHLDSGNNVCAVFLT